MYRVVGGADYTERLKREYERIMREKQNEEQGIVEVSEDEEESEEEDSVVPTQTYPSRSADVPVIRQGGLTCGMCALQNLYGIGIVTRDNMDEHAKRLETQSYGEKMYDPALGYYSIEVLKSVLQENGKHVQHVDIDKIPAEYFTEALTLNPTFQGYIVTLEMEPVKHYVAIRHRQRSYCLMDSLPGAMPQTISNETLFRRRDDGHLYCSQNTSDQRKVISVLAVGNSPFVEYLLLHNTWSQNNPSKKQYICSISRILQSNRRVVVQKAKEGGKEVMDWYASWKNARTLPNKDVVSFLSSFLLSEIQGEKSIVVRYADKVNAKEHQTVVKCKGIHGLLQHLKEMQWLKEDMPFSLRQNGRFLRDEYDEDIEWDTDGYFEDFNICPDEPIDLITDVTTSSMAKIGGFYTFQLKVEGTCIGQQHNAYSVRDDQGNVHVIYKHCIENVTQ